MTEVNKKPISGELRKLKVGGVVIFPMEQRSSVITVVNRMRKDLIRERWDCSLEENLDKYELIVTRTR